MDTNKFERRLSRTLSRADKDVKKKYRAADVKEVNMGRPIEKSSDSSRAGSGHYY